MASALYRPYMKTMMAPGAGGHGGKSINLLDVSTDVISIALIDSNLFPFVHTNTYWEVTGGGGWDADAGLLTGANATKALNTPALINGGSSGVGLDAVDFTAAGAGSLTDIGDGNRDLDAIILWVNVNGGSSTTDPLVAWIDTGTGFGVRPNGSTVDIVWNAAGIINFNFG